MKLIADNALNTLAVTETWLDSSVSDEELAIIGFTLFRCDRPCKVRCSCTSGQPCQKRGGVAFYSRSDLNFCKASILVHGMEMIWLRSTAKITGRAFLLGCLYRPPSADAKFWSCVQELVHHIQGEDIILLGDLNIDSFQTNRPMYQSLHSSLLLPLNLLNKVCSATRTTPSSASSIDYIPTNLAAVRDGVVSPCEFSDHDLVYAALDVKSNTQLPAYDVTLKTRDYRNINFPELIGLLEHANLSSFSSTNVVEMLDEWLGKFNTVLDVVAPYKQPGRRTIPRKKNCPFMTPELLALIRQRKSAFRRYRASGCIDTTLQRCLPL